MINTFCYSKVFGERNCGTSFLQQLIRENTSLEELGHGSNDPAFARAAQLPAEVRDFGLARLIDQLRKDEIPESLGWKHAAVSPEYLQRSYKFAHTLFVFIARNPFAFLLSLYRRPYNAFYSGWPDLRTFLGSPWLCNERDNVGDIFLDSPVRLWNLKNASYVRTQRQIPNAMLISYEALVASPESFLHSMCERFGIRVANELRIPQASTKGDPTQFQQYREQTINFSPDAHFAADELRFVVERLDWQTYNDLGYQQPASAAESGVLDSEKLGNGLP